MPQVLASAEARARLPKLIERLVDHPEDSFELGRQRRREVVLVAAQRYDDLVGREEAVLDLAWAMFADERIANPTSASVSWEDAQARRHAK